MGKRKKVSPRNLLKTNENLDTNKYNIEILLFYKDVGSSIHGCRNDFINKTKAHNIGSLTLQRCLGPTKHHIAT